MATLLINQHRGWFLTYGIILVILGIIAISVVTLTTLLSVMFLGALLLAGSIVIIIDSFKSWRQHTGHFWLYLIVGLLYLVTAILLLVNPLAAAISLTLLLAIFYIVLGIFRIISTLALRLPHWGWSLANGIIALLLGILILIHWPASSLFIIGLFVGIDLLISGWTYIMLSIKSKSSQQILQV